MKRIKRNLIMKKVEIIKIPYKPFRKKLYELFEDSEGKSLVGFIEKSYMNKRGEDLKDFPY